MFHEKLEQIISKAVLFRALVALRNFYKAGAKVKTGAIVQYTLHSNYIAGTGSLAAGANAFTKKA